MFACGYYGHAHPKCQRRSALSERGKKVPLGKGSDKKPLGGKSTREKICIHQSAAISFTDQEASDEEVSLIGTPHQ